MKRPFVVLAGPTAVGKSELSIALAQKINGAIISADSIQVYKYMDIGSAKITKEQMQGIDHYLIDEFLPDEEFHVVKFKEYATRYMERIYEQGKIPILVGGTGFYIQAILKNVDFTAQPSDVPYRMALQTLAKEKGVTFLHAMLKEVDARSADEIHENNVKRVIRALEYHHLSGEKISDHNEAERQKKSPYNYAYFVLNDERKLLYERIEQRIDLMLKQGLVEEVTRLKNMGYTKELVSMQGLGYKEILSYLDGESSLEEAVYILKRDTRHFAKRQLTWFGREADVIWINKNEYQYDNEKILNFMEDTLKDKNIWKQEMEK